MRKPEMEYKDGETLIRIFGPESITPEEQENRIADLYKAAWRIVDECLERGEEV